MFDCPWNCSIFENRTPQDSHARIVESFTDNYFPRPFSKSGFHWPSQTERPLHQDNTAVNLSVDVKTSIWKCIFKIHYFNRVRSKPRIIFNVIRSSRGQLISFAKSFSTSLTTYCPQDCASLWWVDASILYELFIWTSTQTQYHHFYLASLHFYAFIKYGVIDCLSDPVPFVLHPLFTTLKLFFPHPLVYIRTLVTHSILSSIQSAFKLPTLLLLRLFCRLFVFD